jgi:prephenate dehydrogenase
VNLPSRVSRAGDLCEVRIPVPDRAGVLAEVTTLAGALDVNIADLEIAHSSEGDRGVLILLVEAGAADRLRDGLAEVGYRPSVTPLE